MVEFCAATSLSRLCLGWVNEFLDLATKMGVPGGVERPVATSEPRIMRHELKFGTAKAHQGRPLVGYFSLCQSERA